MKDVKGNGQFHALECDVSNEEQINEAFEWVKNNLKTVHILINNAAILRAGTVTGSYKKQYTQKRLHLYDVS